jgi:hypothetical protein
MDDDKGRDGSGRIELPRIDDRGNCDVTIYFDNYELTYAEEK